MDWLYREPERMDRDVLGRIVRKAWIAWASTHPYAKHSWLTPYDDLTSRPGRSIV